MLARGVCRIVNGEFVPVETRSTWERLRDDIAEAVQAEDEELVHFCLRPWILKLHEGMKGLSRGTAVLKTVEEVEAVLDAARVLGQFMQDRGIRGSSLLYPYPQIRRMNEGTVREFLGVR